MNKPALSPVLATVCLATMTIGSVTAMDTDLQSGPSDFKVGVELANKHYDQGVIRNDNVTAIGHFDARFWDIGLHADYYMAINSDNATDSLGWQPEPISAFESTQLNLGVDYLFEIQDLFQFIPHYNFTAYPNWHEQPYKLDQHWLGLDAWWLTPIQGVELGANVDFNPVYNSRRDENSGSGGNHGHDFRTAIAAREFIQEAPLDVSFYQVLNFANGTYKSSFYGMDDEGGVTTFDLGLRYVAPFYLNEFWLTARLEGHFWLENDDRETLRQAGQNTAEVIMAVGFEWKPDSK
jgi:hypothetical protein